MSIGETGYDHLNYYKNSNLPLSYPRYDHFKKIESILGKKFIYQNDFKRQKVYNLEEILS